MSEYEHDDRCEAEYEAGAHAWTPCGCWASRSEAEGLVARAEKAEAKVIRAMDRIAELRRSDDRAWVSTIADDIADELEDQP